MIFCVVSLRPKAPSRLAIPSSPRNIFQTRPQAKRPRCGNENGAIHPTPTTRTRRKKPISVSALVMDLLFVIYSLLYPCIHLQGVAFP